MITSESMKVGQHMCSIQTKKPEQALASRKPMRTVLAVSRQQFCSMAMLSALLLLPYSFQGLFSVPCLLFAQLALFACFLSGCSPLPD